MNLLSLKPVFKVPKFFLTSRPGELFREPVIWLDQKVLLKLFGHLSGERMSHCKSRFFFY